MFDVFLPCSSEGIHLLSSQGTILTDGVLYELVSYNVIEKLALLSEVYVSLYDSH